MAGKLIANIFAGGGILITWFRHCRAYFSGVTKGELFVVGIRCSIISE
jgi:hypothetical protein